MRPRIESIGTPDGEPLESIKVADVRSFNEVVRVLIGPSVGEGEEIFDIYICSPGWIECQCEEKGYWLARRTWVLSHWEVSLVRRAIQETVLRVTGNSWQAISQQLAAFMMWEFQDYKEWSE